MAEEPIKLFSKMSERYPEPSDADVVHAGARALISLVPILGAPIEEVLSLVLAPSVSRRRDEWLKELADMFEELRSRVDGFRVEDLGKNEAFVTAVIQTTRIAASTHQEEKRKILRDALLNIALGTGPDEDTQQIFFGIVESFTVSHILVLDVLWRGAGRMTGALWDQNRVPMNARTYAAAIDVLVPELKGRVDLVKYILSDLRSRGLTELNSLSGSFPTGGTITGMGAQFLRFVLHPDERP